MNIFTVRDSQWLSRDVDVIIQSEVDQTDKINQFPMIPSDLGGIPSALNRTPKRNRTRSECAESLLVVSQTLEDFLSILQEVWRQSVGGH